MPKAKTSSKKTSTFSSGNIEESNIVVGDNNVIQQNEDSETNEHLGRINNTLDEIAYEARVPRSSARDEFSREILETVFASAISGGIIGWIWPLVGNWITAATFPVMLIVTITSSILHITHFGVRHSFILGLSVGMALSLLIDYGAQFTPAEYLAYNVPLMGILFIGMIGAFLGLLAGIVFLFWKPFDM